MEALWWWCALGWSIVITPCILCRDRVCWTPLNGWRMTLLLPSSMLTHRVSWGGCGGGVVLRCLIAGCWQVARLKDPNDPALDIKFIVFQELVR